MSEDIYRTPEQHVEQLRQQVETQEAQDRLRLVQDVTSGTPPATPSDNADLQTATGPQETPITIHPKKSIETLPNVEAESLPPPKMPEGWHPGGPERR